jgi:hypothetical protein
MLARLGNVLFWTGIIIAAAWVSLIWSLGGTAVLVNFGIDTPGGRLLPTSFPPPSRSASAGHLNISSPARGGEMDSSWGSSSKPLPR